MAYSGGSVPPQGDRLELDDTSEEDPDHNTTDLPTNLEHLRNDPGHAAAQADVNDLITFNAIYKEVTSVGPGRGYDFSELTNLESQIEDLLLEAEIAHVTVLHRLTTGKLWADEGVPILEKREELRKSLEKGFDVLRIYGDEDHHLLAFKHFGRVFDKDVVRPTLSNFEFFKPTIDGSLSSSRGGNMAYAKRCSDRHDSPRATLTWLHRRLRTTTCKHRTREDVDYAISVRQLFEQFERCEVSARADTAEFQTTMEKVTRFVTASSYPDSRLDQVNITLRCGAPGVHHALRRLSSWAEEEGEGLIECVIPSAYDSYKQDRVKTLKLVEDLRQYIIHIALLDAFCVQRHFDGPPHLSPRSVKTAELVKEMMVGMREWLRSAFASEWPTGIIEASRRALRIGDTEEEIPAFDPDKNATVLDRYANLVGERIQRHGPPEHTYTVILWKTETDDGWHRAYNCTPDSCLFEATKSSADNHYKIFVKRHSDSDAHVAAFQKWLEKEATIKARIKAVDYSVILSVALVNKTPRHPYLQDMAKQVDKEASTIAEQIKEAAQQPSIMAVLFLRQYGAHWWSGIPNHQYGVYPSEALGKRYALIQYQSKVGRLSLAQNMTAFLFT